MRPIAPRSHAGNYRCSSGRLCGRHRRGRCPRPGSECVGRSSTHPASAVSFYTSPADLADYRPGDVRAARPVSAPAGFLNTDAVQLKFRSTNSEGQPIAAVTTVLSPRGAAPGRPLLSYHPHRQCSGARLCAVDRDVHLRPEARDPRSPWPQRRHREGMVGGHPRPSRPAARLRGGQARRTDHPRRVSAPRNDSTRSASARAPLGWPATPAAEWRLRWPRRSPRPTLRNSSSRAAPTAALR